MAVTPHSEWFNIYGFQIDAEGVATVQSLCEYMEEAAGNHAANLGLSMERLYSEGVAWILSRLQVIPEKLPLLNSRICVETWPVGVEGLQYRRDFIVRNEDGSVAARAASHWVVMNMESRRVGRVPSFIAEVSLYNPATVLEDRKIRPPVPGAEHENCSFRARLVDVDRNRHVNNIRYMDFVLESADMAPGAVGSGVESLDGSDVCGPEGGATGRKLEFIELVFKAEAYQGDIISARTCPFPPEEKRLCHSLARQSDGKELVRAVTSWK